jgi:hypothetical protein
MVDFRRSLRMFDVRIKRMYTKITFAFVLATVLGCTYADERAQKHEKTLIGYWQSDKDRYLEFDIDRTGKECLVMYRNKKPFLPPKLTFDIKRWQLRHDTLVIDFINETPLFTGKLKMDSTNNPGTEYFLIEEMGNDKFVIRKKIQGATFKDNEEFKRVEKIPENN